VQYFNSQFKKKFIFLGIITSVLAFVIFCVPQFLHAQEATTAASSALTTAESDKAELQALLDAYNQQATPSRFKSRLIS
jgi:hypothetical protein